MFCDEKLINNKGIFDALSWVVPNLFFIIVLYKQQELFYSSTIWYKMNHLSVGNVLKVGADRLLKYIYFIWEDCFRIKASI